MVYTVYCCCLPLVPGFACNIHPNLDLPFSCALYLQLQYEKRISPICRQLNQLENKVSKDISTILSILQQPPPPAPLTATSPTDTASASVLASRDSSVGPALPPRYCSISGSSDVESLLSSHKTRGQWPLRLAS